MRQRILTTLLFASLLLSALVVPATLSGEVPDTRITLSSKTRTRDQAVGAIESQTGYKVVYNTRSFDGGTSVNFGHTDLPLSALLDKLVEGSGNVYSIDRNYILLYHGDRFASGSVAHVANRSVTGTVADTVGGAAAQGIRVELLTVGGNIGRSATGANVGMSGDNNNATLGEGRSAASGEDGNTTIGEGRSAASGEDGTTATGSVSDVTTAEGRFRLNGVPTGRQILKLTSGDGSVTRYRQIEVPAGNNLNVLLSMSDDNLASIGSDAPPAGEVQRQRPESKFTAFFRPDTNDHIINALSDEARAEFTFIPTDRLQRNYMPRAAVKTNLLWLATTTPNVAVEFALARRWTFDISAAYNPFRLQKGGINRFGIIQPEVRYWFCQRFEKHFLGLHGLYGRFNIGQVDFLTRTFEQHRYKGWGAGAGVSYGYHLPMGRRWSWEFTVGLGYVYLEYDKFRCYECDELVANKSRHYFGPTKAGVSLVFMIR